MNTFLKDNFLKWVREVGIGEASAILELTITDDHIKQWNPPSKQPSVDHLSTYVERVMVPGILEKARDDKQRAIAEVTAELTDGNPELQQTLLPGATAKDLQNKLRNPAPPPAAPAGRTYEPSLPFAPKVSDSYVEEETVDDAMGLVVDRVAEPPPAQMEAAKQMVNLDIASLIAQKKDSLTAEDLNALRNLFFGWEGRKVSLTTPFYKYTNPATLFMLFAYALDLGKEKIHMRMKTGDAQIHHTRSHMATDFLGLGAEWALWCDDDMIVPFGRPDIMRFYGSLPESYPQKALAVHGLERLLSHRKSLIGATYWGRQPKGKLMFHEGKNDENIDRHARTFPDEIRPTKWVGTGFMLVHRSVFLDIQKKFPELAPSGRGRDYWNFFQPMDDAGEDAAFCIRAAAAGHQPFVDLGLHALHVGYACYGAHNTTPNFREP